MDNLLRNSFTAHYKIAAPSVSNLTFCVSESYFEIEDKNKELLIHKIRGKGMARFSNPSGFEISISNYEKFVDCLPHTFQRGKGRCDMIMVCEQAGDIILGEIKDSKSLKKYRKDSKRQLLQSLKTLLEVRDILVYFNSMKIRKCCYFNSQSKAPSTINAVSAFNRLPGFFPNGFQMKNQEIESLNFAYYEYKGEQTLTFR